MTTREIKYEINKVLDEIPENVLQDVLDYLKQVQRIPNEQTNISKHLRKILTEDKNVLEKLAK